MILVFFYVIILVVMAVKKIAIDIDNTICDTSLFYGKLAKDYDRNHLHKKSNIDYTKVVPRSDDWNDEELFYYLDNIYNKLALNIPLKEDVSLYINKLKKLGFEIIFITYRGLKEFDHTDLITPKYLEINNIPYDDIITGTKNKYEYIKDCDYFVDDAIRHCEEALENTNCKVIMMSSDITKGYKNDKFYIANNWKEVFDYIKSSEGDVYDN